MKKTIEVDQFGRVLIPIALRKKFNMSKNSTLFLSTINNGFIIKSEIDKYKKIINKLKIIEEKYNFDIILMSNDNVIYISKNIEKLINKIIKNTKSNKSELIEYLSNTNYVTDSIKISENEKGDIYIVYKDKKEEKLAKLVCTVCK